MSNKQNKTILLAACFAAITIVAFVLAIVLAPWKKAEKPQEITVFSQAWKQMCDLSSAPGHVTFISDSTKLTYDSLRHIQTEEGMEILIISCSQFLSSFNQQFPHILDKESTVCSPYSLIRSSATNGLMDWNNPDLKCVQIETSNGFKEDKHWNVPEAPTADWINTIIFAAVGLLFLIITIVTLFWKSIMAAFGKPQKAKISFSQDFAQPATNDETPQQPTTSAPVAPSPFHEGMSWEEVLKTYDSTYKCNYSKTVAGWKEEAQNARKTSENFRNATTLKDVLMEVDRAYNKKAISKLEEHTKATRKSAQEEYERVNKIEEIGRKARALDDLAKSSSEKSLLSQLDEIRKTYNQKLPQITTLKLIYETATRQTKEKEEIIRLILDRMQEFVNDPLNLRAEFTDLADRAHYADRVRTPFETVQKEVNQLTSRPELKNVLAKESLNYWDRLAITVWAYEFFHAILSAFGTKAGYAGTHADTLKALKADMQLLYVARYFLRNLESKSADMQAMENDLPKIRAKFAESRQLYNIDLPCTDEYTHREATYREAYKSIVATNEYVDLMWKHFVEDFVNNAVDKDDHAWFAQRVLEIALHSADYVNCLKGRDLAYCSNLNFLRANLDTAELPKETKFAENDYAHSDKYSNRVYHWLDELNVHKLRALVSNYLIKP